MKYMKTIIKLIGLLLLTGLVLGLSSCEDFLNRPTEDGYTVSTFYQNDEQCLQAVNPIYNSPWHDFSRAFFKIGEVQSGNYYWTGPYQDFTLTSSNEDLANMSASLWSVNAYCNSIIENINLYAGPQTTEAGRNMAKGEALVWKAMAYFFMVRIWGEVPIIHNNSAEIATGNYNKLYKATTENLYDYIIMTLEKAIEWLPARPGAPGRMDKYSAYGLLAKVYLTKSGLGQTGTRHQEDLDKAAEYALKVINESGRVLVPVYSDIFRLKNNLASESLIAWRWTVAPQWTASNAMQPDLCLAGFDDFGGWGGWNGPSVDLQDAFGEDALNLTQRRNGDARRKATMMMYGDKYEYFWADRGGFDWTAFQLGRESFDSPTGANAVKHLVGDNYDHIQGTGVGIGEMKTSLATHLLRLADVYLIYAEAVLGNNASTTDTKALAVFNAVRTRAGVSTKTSITFDDIWKERRLELACEGDFWYDFVRLHYYKPDEALNILKAQRRKTYVGLNDYYKAGNGTIIIGGDGKPTPRYNTDMADLNITHDKFFAPFPDTDLAMNPNLREAPVEYDLSGYTY